MSRRERRLVMSERLQKEKDPRGKRESFHALNVPSSSEGAQEYTAPEITPEIAIETFCEDAREPVCDNLKRYCREWQRKKAQIIELERIILTLPIIENQISLRGLYEVMLPKMQQELRQIEWHIRRLQHCLELLEQQKIFTKPADIPGHIDVSTLKNRLDIVDVVSRWVELRQSGRTHKGRCPFHDDRSPSFVVYPENKRWWCFACSEGGDVITFVQKIRNCGFREAVVELQRL